MYARHTCRIHVRCSPRRPVIRERRKVGETGNARGVQEREKERDAPGHEAGEPREGRSLSPSHPSLFSPLSPRHGRRTPRRYTGTFSHSFSVPSLTCTETDDDDENDDNIDDGIVDDVVTPTSHMCKSLTDCLFTLKSYSSSST